jgi:hypothetical protein
MSSYRHVVTSQFKSGAEILILGSTCAAIAYVIGPARMLLTTPSPPPMHHLGACRHTCTRLPRISHREEAARESAISVVCYPLRTADLAFTRDLESVSLISLRVLRQLDNFKRVYVIHVLISCWK